MFSHDPFWIGLHDGYMTDLTSIIISADHLKTWQADGGSALVKRQS